MSNKGLVEVLQKWLEVGQVQACVCLAAHLGLLGQLSLPLPVGLLGPEWEP